MRWPVVLLMVMACGPTPQPRQPDPEQTDEDHVRAVQPPAPIEPVNAEVEARKAAVDEAMKKYAEKEAAETAATYDAIAKPPVDPDPDSEVGPGDVVYTDDAENEDEDEYENGVLIGAAKKPVYCASSGRFSGLCWDNAADCRKRGRASCTSTRSFACFAATARTSGEQRVMCFSTYGACDALSNVAVNAAEYSDVRECVIWRVKPKAKVKKR